MTYMLRFETQACLGAPYALIMLKNAWVEFPGLWSSHWELSSDRMMPPCRTGILLSRSRRAFTTS